MNNLTENTVKNAEIREKQYKIYDGDGMFLLIHPNGSKYWRMKYTFDGKSKLASFGVWPKISLKQARERRSDAKHKIQRGINPIKIKHTKKQYHQSSYKDKESFDYYQSPDSVFRSFQWSMLLYPNGKNMKTEESLRILKACIFEKIEMKSFPFLNKQEVTDILGNIGGNRRVLFAIIWELYISSPVLNIAVLLLLLIILMDFFPALLTTLIYFIITIFTAVIFGLWYEKKDQK